MVAVSWLLETNEVVRADPSHSATEEETKFDPFKVKVNPRLPAAVEVGDMEVKTGLGEVELEL